MSNCIIESPNEHATALANGLTFPEPVRAHYDSHRRCYWIENARREWITIDETSFRRMLRHSGISTKCVEGEFVSPLEKELVRTQTGADVDYAGPLAGYRMGCHEVCGKRVLVTSQPKLIQPQPGECPNLDILMANLFDDADYTQSDFVYGWLKIAIEALLSQRLCTGQVLAIAGERGCGKSLFQKIITEIFGGRAAKPFRYMTGDTNFNSELFGAEHLMIEDEVASTDLRKRREFGARIKDFCVNEIQSCHGKNRNAISLKPFWRVSITLNDEPENLMILPPVDESLKDKIILLKAHKRPMPMNTETSEGMARFWAAIQSELPAFVHKVMQFQIPTALKSERFGITHFHHPQLIEEIDELSPESKLLAMIDATLFSIASHWEGTAEQLKQILCSSSFGYDARKLLDWSNATGTYLGRLARKYPRRFAYDRTERQRLWTIQHS